MTAEPVEKFRQSVAAPPEARNGSQALAPMITIASRASARSYGTVPKEPV